MAFTLPDLPYAHDALAALGMSKETLDFHHDLHHKAYVDNEVGYHQAVIDALDKTLIPNAKNAELKETLVKIRPAFVAHLEHAKKLQASLQ